MSINNQLLQLVRKHYSIIIILLLALVLRLFALYEYGLNLTLNSDDVGYTKSARVLIQTGMLTYHQIGEPTVHIMPGQSFLLALVFLIFGFEEVGLYAARVVISLFGITSILFVYLIGKYVFNKCTGLIAAFLLAIFVPQILTDNLLLTESPFMAGMYVLLYCSLKLANERKWSYFFGVIFSYLFCLMFRPTIALYPLVLLIYLLLKKYPLKMMLKQFLIALVLLLIVLGPWWIRNYIHYHEFIPLSGGTGNPLLLGTYQGSGYRYGEPYDDVIKKINKEHPNISAYENMNLQKEAAIDRIKLWWKSDPKSFLRSYTIEKTIKQWNTSFYWKEIFGVKIELMQKIHKLTMVLATISMILSIFLYKRSLSENVLLFGILAYFTVLNNIFFAFDRYNQPLMSIWFLFIGSIISYFSQKTKSIFRLRS